MAKNIKEDKRLKDELISKKKSTKAELDLRVSEVQSLILQGYTRKYLIQYGSKWELSDRQIDDYISMATIAIKEINHSSVQDNMAIVTSCLWDLYRKTIKEGNNSEANKVLMNIAKLRGLEQHTINHIIEDKRELESLSDEELNSVLEGNDE